MKKFLIIFILLNFIMACKTIHSQKSVVKAMRHYDELIRKIDAEGIANLYMPDGKMGSFAKGRDSIRAALSAFKNVKILYQHSSSDSVIMSGDSCIQTGLNEQQGIINGKDSFHVKSKYKVQWLWLKNEKGWRIKTYESVPVK